MWVESTVSTKPFLIIRKATFTPKLWLVAVLVSFFMAVAPAFAKDSEDPASAAKNEVFKRILAKADEGKWKELPIGELMGKIANQLVGTPYVGWSSGSKSKPRDLYC